MNQQVIKEIVIKIFDNIKQQVGIKDINSPATLINPQNNLSLTSTKNISKAYLLNYIEAAKKESIKILDEINNKNIPTNSTLPYFKNNYKNFNDNYERISISLRRPACYEGMTEAECSQFINDFYEKKWEREHPSAAGSNKEEETKPPITNRELLKTLKTARITLIGISTGAAIAAAGFGALAFAFGITTIWAVACTTLSAAAGVAASAITSEITVLENGPLSIDEKAQLSLIMNMAKILKTFLTVSSATSIFYPASLAAVATISAIMLALELG
ncbi:hypothetical protein [Williamsoniiplasma luminosum]|uniref:hypothetical protein n=1 Tax=Williamsoniiplasma luminosum TaxID=214888 RepID=UPI0012EC904F|nr:hypothetical protein [Williamsoniiplasma luminosum]